MIRNHQVQNNMDVLIGIVIAVFIITAVYVGYYASQTEPEGETHSIPSEPKIQSHEITQIISTKADQISIL